ncbi:hypothetical protein P4544_05400 [Halomonas sp. LY9]
MDEKKKYLSWMLSAAGIVTLGAIGSGVWQIVGQPIVNAIVEFSVNTINIFFSSYKDSIYAMASFGFHERASNNLFILVMMLMLFIPFFLSVRKRFHSNSGSVAFLFSVIRTLRILNLAILVSLVIYLVTQSSYVNRVIIYVDTSLDRLAPYESQEKIIELRAKFREVQTTSDYHSLYSEIEGLILDNGLESRSQPPL